MYIGSQELMKNYDTYLLEHGYSIIELVDKASDCLLKHICYDKNVIVCGPGNNGADGLSLALKLHEILKEVMVVIFDDQRISEANRYYLDLCLEKDLNVQYVHQDNFEYIFQTMKEADAIIDAMFGFGLNSSPRGMYQEVIDEINCLYDQEIIAIDIPTGLNCNTGKPYSSVVCATQTITLTAFKNGFLNPDSAFFTGKVIVEELDVDDVFDEVGLYQLIGFKEARSILKKRQYDGYKGTYGYAGLIAGSLQYKGAALLCTKACVYSGTGITTLISLPEVIESLTLYTPEATSAIRQTDIDKESFKKYHALLIGCGIGLDIESYRLFHEVMTKTSQPLLIDADALTILSTCLDLLYKQQRPIVLTPHIGEMKRLCTIDEKDDLLMVAKNFAKKYHITLVLKGPQTIVTNGEESYRVHAGNEAMATGGMGDVLSGIIVSFLAQGYKAIDACLLGVYLHGYTADQLAKDAYTVIPSRLIERIPVSMKEIEKK